MDALLSSVVDVAKRAGAAILEVYSQPFDVAHKEDKSPLTEADLRAHAIIVEGLQAIAPTLPVLSEEDSNISFEKRRGWHRYWLVDPLDGTKEFVSRNGEFTVNIALIENHVPVLGVVHVPVSNTTYVGSRGHGAFRQTDDQLPVAIKAAAHAHSPVRVVGSRSHAKAGSMDTYLDRLGAHSLRSIGSSLKFCLIADGSADVYPRFGPTSEWDTAAAHAVVEAAGGAVVDLRGQPLRYNTKPDLLNPNFLAYGEHTDRWVAALHR
ncbi:MAG: 3'(2'),5'-bisphosphate nucleotidase CysQ [Povalibacter sp.]|jgi:3'(2'), 5'-bisphosphate nucleotidase